MRPAKETKAAREPKGEGERAASGGGAARRAFACLAGMEALVAEEVLGAKGAAKADVRPGIVITQDHAAPKDAAILPPLEPAFARAEWTLWHEAKARSLQALADEIAGGLADAVDPGAAPPALHVWAQGSGPARDLDAKAKSLEKALRRALGGRVRSKIAAEVGADVLDVALTAPGEALVGAHRRARQHSAFPGGRRRLSARDEAPSRSHLKLEEGLEWADLPLKPADVAIDVGCAPGGWSFVLLERGLYVHGIDPTPVAKRVENHERFTLHESSVRTFRATDAPGARWLFCDMNGPPADALGLLERLVPRLPDLDGCFHTIKLSDDPPIPSVTAARKCFRGMGFRDVLVRHLYHNRDEVTLVARR